LCFESEMQKSKLSLTLKEINRSTLRISNHKNQNYELPMYSDANEDQILEEKDVVTPLINT
jgi:hypothetical protein